MWKDLILWLRDEPGARGPLLTGILTILFTMLGLWFTLKKELNTFKEAQESKRQIKGLEIQLEQYKNEGRKLDARSKELDLKTAELGARTTRQEQRVQELRFQSAELEHRNVILAAETARLQRSAFRVQASLTPRGTLVRNLEALPLLPYAETEVEIAAIGSDEARGFARELAAFLYGSRWKLDLQTVMTPPKLPMAGRSGTLIFTNAASSQHVKDALEALVSKLIAVGIEVPGMHELSRGKQDIITVEIKSREEFRPAP